MNTGRNISTGIYFVRIIGRKQHPDSENFEDKITEHERDIMNMKFSNILFLGLIALLIASPVQNIARGIQAHRSPDKFHEGPG